MRAWHATISVFVGLATVAVLTAACQSNTYYIIGEAHDTPDGAVLYLSTDDSSGISQDTCGSSGCHTAPTLLDSITVSGGRFGYTATTDTARLCHLYDKARPESSVTLFLEPGNIYVELSKKEGRSRVSGTVLNNQWQALNDTVAKYDARLRQLMLTAGDSISPRRLHAQVAEIYDNLTRRISEAALNNRDNALGRFIATHWQQH